MDVSIDSYFARAHDSIITIFQTEMGIAQGSVLGQPLCDPPFVDVRYIHYLCVCCSG